MERTTRPNIVVFLTDDHGQWAAGCYGNREIHTPAIDGLAATGVRMANAMTITPVCSPARATFWTGLYPSQHGIHDYLGDGAYRDGPWIEEQITLGQLLTNAGYRCGFFGKWHCGTPEKAPGGFEDWYCSGRRTGPHVGNQRYIHNGRMVQENGFQAETTTNAALRFLTRSVAAADTSGDRRPFFAFIGLVATHSPFADHPRRLVERYRNSRFVDVPCEPRHPFGRLAGEGRLAKEENRRMLQQQYYAAVTEIDEQVGRVMAFLRRSGVLDNTMVVYTADHGLNVGHHDLFGKGNATRPLNMLEESIRVPLIVGGWGSVNRAGVCPSMVDHADLFRTLVDAAEAALPADRFFPGRSFLSALTASPDRSTTGNRAKQTQIGEYGDLRMARSLRYKLLRRNGRGDDQLFDLVEDPRETRNLLTEHPLSVTIRAVVAQLDRALQEAFAPFSDSPKNGLRVAELRPHNPVEAWRGDPL